MNVKYALTHWKDVAIYILSFFHFLNDETYIRIKYRIVFGKKINLSDPVTFNEKLQWLKIHNRDNAQTMMVDKYTVRKHIAETLGEEYLIPLLEVWDSVEEIDISKLPDRFVLKCSHDSKSTVICKDKSTFDTRSAYKKLNKKFHSNQYWWGREWPYKNTTPRIIAEQYMEDCTGKGDLTDYKLHYFSGECKAIMVGQGRFGENGFTDDFYTPQWEHFDFQRGNTRNAIEKTQRPEKLEEMIELGKKLAKNYPFVRIDFYIINKKIYFGEITFFPGSGFIPFNPDRWDKVFGDWITLSEK